MSRLRSLIAVGIAAPVVAASAQPSFVRPELSPPAVMGQRTLDSIRAIARTYPFVGFKLFGSDSALLVFEDSMLTAVALDAGKWMFGPPPQAAELDGCPAQKVLGRKIARAFWRSSGRPASLQNVMVQVRGTTGIDKWTSTTMYYHRPDLVGQWAGDARSR